MEAAGTAPAGTTARPQVKLAVGVLAGVSAVLLPRVLALSAQGDAARLVFFPAPYFYLAAGVGIFVGLVMMMFEYQVPARPRDTFMAALGIPAIITGALGTASAADGVARAEREAAQLRELVARDYGIGKAGEPIAQAGEAPVRFGIGVDAPQFIVVLQKAVSAEDAQRAQQDLRRQLPGAQAIGSGQSYFVVLDASPAGETAALLAAARAKSLTHGAVQPVLVEVTR